MQGKSLNILKKELMVAPHTKPHTKPFQKNLITGPRLHLGMFTLVALICICVWHLCFSMHSIWSVRPVVLRQERPGPLVPELMWHDWLPLRDRLSHCPVWVPPCVRRQVGPHMPSKLGESLLSYFVRWVNGHKHFKCVYTYLTVVHIVNTTFSFLSQKTMEAVFTFSVNGCQQKICKLVET